MNPDPPIRVPATEHGSAKKNSMPKVPRQTLSLAPALAERLAKEKWKLRADGKQNEASDEGEARV